MISGIKFLQILTHILISLIISLPKQFELNLSEGRIVKFFPKTFKDFKLLLHLTTSRFIYS